MWRMCEKSLEKKKKRDYFLPLFLPFTSIKFHSIWWLAVIEILEFYF